MRLMIGQRWSDFALYVLPFTAGGFIYIAGSDLIPELNKEVRIGEAMRQLGAMALGILVMALLIFIE